jgi:hypothetical protein
MSWSERVAGPGLTDALHACLLTELICCSVAVGLGYWFSLQLKTSENCILKTVRTIHVNVYFV